LGERYDKKYCPKCGGVELIKYGSYKQKQLYRCKYCRVVFVLQKSWINKAYKDYCFGKLSLKQLSCKYKKDIRTLQRNFVKLKPNMILPNIKDRHINLVFDGVYFGRGLCYLVFRANGVNIYYKRVGWETITDIAECLKDIEALGYSFKSFTIDGKKGLVEYLQTSYRDVPIQHCQFHQKQIIKQCITGRPKTQCGVELKALTDKLCEHDYDSFSTAYAALKVKWNDYLKERNEGNEFKHRKLRRAFRSIKKNMPRLFTHKTLERLKIPPTTNSCEGYFGQLKSKVRIHSGMRLNNKIKLIETLLNSSL
jgi:hypothetical protein